MKTTGKRRGKPRLLAAGALAAGLLLLLAAGLLLWKTLWVKSYPLVGVDVSHHQGEIDWEQIKGRPVTFAFVKATEGSGYVDAQFAANWEGAQAAGLYVGAYHFLSFESPAQTQAANYTAAVGALSGRLPPVVDAEYYGDYAKEPPPREEVQALLQELLALLEEQYGQKPILYTTTPFYHRYLAGAFEEYPLWIRNVYTPPLGLGREWQFWQYSDRGRLPGVSGPERRVDFNLFCGSEADLQELLVE